MKLSAWRSVRTPEGKEYFVNGTTSVWDVPVVPETVAIDGKGRDGAVLVGKMDVGQCVVAYNDWARAVDVKGMEEGVDLEGFLKAFRELVPQELLKSLWRDDVGAVVVPSVRGGEEGEEEFVWGPFHLWYRRRGFSLDEEAIGGMVVCSVFRFAGAYRDTLKYARGLVHLAEAVRTILPKVELRVYFDRSVMPSYMGVGRDAEIWRWAWSMLDAMGHVRAVRFESPAFGARRRMDGVEEHLDLFGTLARCLPLFRIDGPKWATGPVEGVPVYCSDADFQDWNLERVALLMFKFEMEHGSKMGRVLALSTGGSVAARHLPCPGLPPMMSGNLISSKRFPSVWLQRFLSDAARGVGGSRCAGLYAATMRSASQRNYTFERRKVALQESVFPFGIDEYFLTVVLAPCAIAAEEESDWCFVVVPAVDRVLRKLLDLCTNSTNQHLLTPLQTSCSACAPTESNPSKIPSAAAERAKVYARVDETPKPLLMFSQESGDPLRADLLTASIQGLRAMVSGLAPHNERDLEWAMQNAKFIGTLAHAHKGIATSWSFRLGKGAKKENPLDETPKQLLQYIADDLSNPIPTPAIPPELNNRKRSRN